MANWDWATAIWNTVDGAGNLAEWFTGLVAAVALIAAVAGARSAGKSTRASLELLDLERKREDRADKAERERRLAAEQAQQADYVAAWHGSEFIEGSGSFGVALVTSRWVRHVVVQNGSQLPVYDFDVEFHDPDDGAFRGSKWVGVLPPGRQTIDYPDLALEESIIPSDEGPKKYKEKATDLDIVIAFTDTAGRTWRRDGDGLLTLVERKSRGSAAGSVTWTGAAKGTAPKDGWFTRLRRLRRSQP